MAVSLGPNCPGCAKPIPRSVIKNAVLQKKDIRCSCRALRSWRTLVELYQPNDSWTVKEVRDYLTQFGKPGQTCPCCAQELLMTEAAASAAASVEESEGD